MGITFNCEYCGKEKTIKPSKYNVHKHHFCCAECFHKWRSVHAIGENAMRWNGGKITVTCDMCGVEYKNWISQIKNNKYNFCSNTCRHEFSRTVVKLGGITWDGKQYRKCIICNNIIECTVGIYHDRYGACCSRECVKIYNSTRKEKYGDNTYCYLFNNEFKSRVRDFFGNKCILCGKTKEENKKNLDVHHVIKKDKDAGCDSDDSLFVVLCRSCHMKIHMKDLDYYEQLFKDLIITKYNGKCYYTREEYYDKS